MGEGARRTRRSGLRAGAIAAAIGLGVATSAAAAQLRSVYTSVSPDNCLLFQKEALGEGRVCPGEAEFNLVLTEFDSRFALELVHPDWTRNAVATVTAVAPAFSWRSGKVAEWRVGSEGPVALILRIAVASTRDRPERAETRLLVLKIDESAAAGACLVGAVSGRAGGNEAARAMADQAAGLPCLR